MRLDNLRPKGVVGTRSIDKEHWTHQVQPIRAKRGGLTCAAALGTIARWPSTA